MKKSDLKNGMLVETREGNLYLVVGDFITKQDGFDLLSNYDENLKNKVSNKLDIMKTYEYKNDRYGNNAAAIRTLFYRELLTQIWERIEYNLTKHEVQILEALQTLGYKWLAKDQDGELFAYINKPKKLNSVWLDEIIAETRIYENLFSFIEWKDNEPIEIEEMLK